MNGRAIQPVMADIMAVHLTSSRPRYIPSSACKTVGLPENEERKIRATFWYGTFQQLICLDWLFRVFCSYCKMRQLQGFYLSYCFHGSAWIKKFKHEFSQAPSMYLARMAPATTAEFSAIWDCTWRQVSSWNEHFKKFSFRCLVCISLTPIKPVYKWTHCNP